MTKLSYVLLGSNINPEENIKKAIQHMNDLFDVVSISQVFESRPVKKRNVDNYLNAVVGFTTDLDPVTIKFECLRKIEDKMGRVRTEDKFKPRKIDLDLIIWGSEIYIDDDKGIEIPDPEILKYGHVALPLADIAPDLIHPTEEVPMKDIAKRFESDSSVKPTKFH